MDNLCRTCRCNLENTPTTSRGYAEGVCLSCDEVESNLSRYLGTRAGRDFVFKELGKLETLGTSHELDVREFVVEKFGQLNFDKPGRLTKRKLIERAEFLREELREFTDAAGLAEFLDGKREIVIDESTEQDFPGQADALVDLVYVAIGTAVMMGLPWQKLWDDVQRANMAKERGVGKRGHLVDCVKPPGWVGPKTAEILDAAGYDPNEPERDDEVHMNKEKAS